MSQVVTLQKSIQITNEDNMELMSRYEDKHFDLAIVDPPYGIDRSGYECGSKGNHKWKNPKKKVYEKKEWDSSIPPKEYFNELFRVSKNQIIWGGNYFIDYLYNTMGVIAWDKKVNGNFSEFEMAWTSFQSRARIFEFMWNGFRKKVYEERIHPTQKPVSLYTWLLKEYAKENDKILDTHLGSGSIAIAVDSVNKVEKMNLTLTACEADQKYYDDAMQRINDKTQWQSLF